MDTIADAAHNGPDAGSADGTFRRGATKPVRVFDDGARGLMRAWIVLGIVSVALTTLIVVLASRSRAAHAAPRRRRPMSSAPPRRQRTTGDRSEARRPTPEPTPSVPPVIDLRERTTGQCPRCGRAATAGERNRSVTCWRCGWCEHSWEVADGAPWPDVMLCLWIPRISAPVAREAR